MNDLAEIIERFWGLTSDRIPVGKAAIAQMRSGHPAEVFALKDVVHGIKGEAQLLRLRPCATLMEAADKLTNVLIDAPHTTEACDALEAALTKLDRMVLERVGVSIDREVAELDRVRGRMLGELDRAFERARTLTPTDRRIWEKLGMLYVDHLSDLVSDEQTAELQGALSAVEAFYERMRKQFADSDPGISMALALADKAGLGFSGSSRGTYCSFSVEALCDDEGGKKRNASFWSAHRFFQQLATPESVGQEAARRALRKLGAQKLATAELPVVFDSDASRALLRTLASVVSGGAIYRKSSYLCGREGTQVASPLITIVDDPLRPRGPGSRTFDGEGLAARRNVIVDQGILSGYLLDSYSARKLGRRSNGCAGRSVGGSPHVTTSNLILHAGTTEPQGLLDGIERGLYVTDMMGFGFNAVTGDFSRGAAGFLIENGQLTVPVSEVTISANFDDLLKRIDAVGSDLDERSSTMSPSLRVSKMTVAGH